MKIYLAGKIGQRCWRHELIPRLAGYEAEVYEPWPIWPLAVMGRWDYVGPYYNPNPPTCDGFTRWTDHGTRDYRSGSHTRADHGVFDPGTHGCMDYGWVAKECFRTIKLADLVFAWIDCVDCYGTLVELGWASALGKPTLVACPETFHGRDLWMAFQCSTSAPPTYSDPTSVRFATPREALCYWQGMADANMQHQDPQEVSTPFDGLREEDDFYLGEMVQLSVDLLGRSSNEAGNSWVYFIRQGYHGPIKIGVSRDVQARMRSLQSACPEPLRLLGQVRGGMMMEANLHQHFQVDRLQGEWFRPSPPLMALIRQMVASGQEVSQ